MLRKLNPPSISVVINNYNYDRYLAEALDSALSQLHEDDEIIVVDDGSTDDSRTILQQYKTHEQITVIEQKNQGQMNAVRTGVRAASGEVVALLDSDDYYLPGYLDRLRNFYRDHADIDFAFCAATLKGQDINGVKANRENLSRMELTPGRIGPTRWATQLFYEYVGVPTSGNSLRNSLARRIITIPATLDSMRPLSPAIVKRLRIPENEAKTPAPSADGVFIRVASLLEAQKYYDEQAGYVYRIHGKNKFAGISRTARLYLRARRMKFLIDCATAHFDLTRTPTALELRQEILGRVYGLRLRRRISVRARYARAVFFSDGSVGEKVSALKAAFLGR